nr:MAG TPA: hypothetical protein [Microviridae sp.]
MCKWSVVFRRYDKEYRVLDEVNPKPFGKNEIGFAKTKKKISFHFMKTSGP